MHTSLQEDTVCAFCKSAEDSSSCYFYTKNLLSVISTYQIVKTSYKSRSRVGWWRRHL